MDPSVSVITQEFQLSYKHSIHIYMHSLWCYHQTEIKLISRTTWHKSSSINNTLNNKVLGSIQACASLQNCFFSLYINAINDSKNRKWMSDKWFSSLFSSFKVVKYSKSFKKTDTSLYFYKLKKKKCHHLTDCSVSSKMAIKLFSLV